MLLHSVFFHISCDIHFWPLYIQDTSRSKKFLVGKIDYSLTKMADMIKLHENLYRLSGWSKKKNIFLEILEEVEISNCK